MPQKQQVYVHGKQSKNVQNLRKSDFNVAAKTKAETSKTKSLLKAMKIKTPRTIKGVTLLDQIRKSKIREDLHVEDVVRFSRNEKQH